MRQIAHHIYIKELLDGDYEEKEGWEPNILHTARGKVSRVNIIGTILSISGQTVLDDGTGQLALRTFEEVPGFNEAKSGQVSLVIGRPRKYQDSLYLIPEVVREINPGWAAIRKKELGMPANYEKEEVVVNEEPKEESYVENEAERLIGIIADLDKGEGAQVEDVIKDSGLKDNADEIINQLLLDGEIFEVKPGVVKVL